MSSLTPSEKSLAFWEKVLEDAKQEELVAWDALKESKANPLATKFDIKEAQKNYDDALKGRNLNEITVRELKEKLHFRIYKKAE